MSFKTNGNTILNLGVVEGLSLPTRWVLSAQHASGGCGTRFVPTQKVWGDRLWMLWLIVTRWWGNAKSQRSNRLCSCTERWVWRCKFKGMCKTVQALRGQERALRLWSSVTSLLQREGGRWSGKGVHLTPGVGTAPALLSTATWVSATRSMFLSNSKNILWKTSWLNDSPVMFKQPQGNKCSLFIVTTSQCCKPHPNCRHGQSLQHTDTLLSLAAGTLDLELMYTF